MEAFMQCASQLDKTRSGWRLMLNPRENEFSQVANPCITVLYALGGKRSAGHPIYISAHKKAYDSSFPVELNRAYQQRGRWSSVGTVHAVLLIGYSFLP